MPVWTLREEASGDIYVVNRDLVEALGKFSAKTLLTVCITRAGNLFVWPVRLPRWDGSIDSYNGSALQIIGEHQGGAWLQVAADRREHVYCVTFPTKSWTPPEWPEIAADDVFRRAFKGNVIESMDHPVVQRIQGVD